jgi:C_GCAxxG_C_C family probable redox protein
MDMKGDGEKAFLLGYDYHKKYGVCSQCVLAAVQETMGFVHDDVIKSAHALAGGVVRGGDGTCGSLLGGVMAISCKCGRERKDFGSKPVKSFELSKKLRERFIQKYGDTTCFGVQRKIFGRTFNFWDEKERGEFMAANQGESNNCHEITGNLAKWTVEILNENEKLKMQ